MLATIPGLVAAALIWVAASEDAYRDNGSSYWTTRPESRGYLVVAVAINLVAVAVALSAGFRGRPRFWVGVVLTIVGLLAGFVGWAAMTVN